MSLPLTPEFLGAVLGDLPGLKPRLRIGLRPGRRGYRTVRECSGRICRSVKVALWGRFFSKSGVWGVCGLLQVWNLPAFRGSSLTFSLPGDRIRGSPRKSGPVWISLKSVGKVFCGHLVAVEVLFSSYGFRGHLCRFGDSDIFSLEVLSCPNPKEGIPSRGLASVTAIMRSSRVSWLSALSAAPLLRPT